MKLVTQPRERQSSAPQDEPRKAGLLDVARAVFWSFLGIRKRAAHEKDAVTIKPIQVIIAGIIGALIFVMCLVVLVRFITSSAGAREIRTEAPAQTLKMRSEDIGEIHVTC